MFNLTQNSQQRSDKLGGAQAWSMWFVAQLFALLQFSLQLSSGAMVDDLMSNFMLTACGGGILSSVYYYVYVSLQTPAGVLLDRFGPRRLLSAGALVCGLGCTIFSHAFNLPFAVLGRLLMGGGAAFAFVGMLTILVRWFPARRFTIMVGIVESLGMLASLGGGFYLAVVIDGLGWRACMQGMSYLLLFLAPLLWLVVRDEPASTDELSDTAARLARQVPFKDFWHSLKKLLKNKQAWANGLYSGFGFAILSVFGALWGVPFLRLQYHFDLTTAVLLANLLFAGAAIGCPLMSVIDAYIAKRCWFLASASLMTGIFLSVIIFTPSLPVWLLAVLLLLTGFSCSAYVINFTVGKEIVGPALHSTSLGFVNTLSVVTAPLFQPLVGWIMDLLAHRGSDGVLHYSLMNYQVGLSVLILAQLVAIYLSFKIPERPQFCRLTT